MRASQHMMSQEREHAPASTSQGYGYAREETAMATIQVTFDKPSVSAEEYVYVRVCAGPTPDQPYGFCDHITPNSGGATVHSTPNNPVPIRDAWEQANAYAQAHNLSLIYIDDPNKQFPADELGVRKV
jgi:hypothetical protein